MTRPLNIVTVNGSYSSPGKTEVLLELIVEEFQKHHEATVLRVAVGNLGPGFTNALSRDQVSMEVEEKLRAVENADLVIVGTPVFRGSYTGLFKHFFDLLEQYSLSDWKSVV